MDFTLSQAVIFEKNRRLRRLFAGTGVFSVRDSKPKGLFEAVCSVGTFVISVTGYFLIASPALMA